MTEGRLSMQIEEEVKQYETARKLSEKYKADIKPCIASLLDAVIMEGQSSFRRTEYGLLIGTELRDKGIPEEKIEDVLTKWNYKNVRPPETAGRIKSLLRQVFKYKANGEYKYKPTCNGKYTEGLIADGHCLGLEVCFHYLTKSNKRIRSHDYNQYIIAGYQYILTSSEQVLLQALLRLQRLKKHNVIFTSYRELNYQTGIHLSKFHDLLKTLEAYKIISLSIGQPLLWKHSGTEITILSIPKIPKQYIAKPKEYKHYMKGIIA